MCKCKIGKYTCMWHIYSMSLDRQKHAYVDRKAKLVELSPLKLLFVVFKATLACTSVKCIWQSSKYCSVKCLSSFSLHVCSRQPILSMWLRFHNTNNTVKSLFTFKYFYFSGWFIYLRHKWIDAIFFNHRLKYLHADYIPRILRPFIFSYVDTLSYMFNTQKMLWLNFY